MPRISPDSLMVSDYPERLRRTACCSPPICTRSSRRASCTITTIRRDSPTGASCCAPRTARREPAIVQFISGRGGPAPTRWRSATRRRSAFLSTSCRTKGASSRFRGEPSINIVNQDLPAGNVVCNLLQLRELSSGERHLTLWRKTRRRSRRRADPARLLASGAQHARGIYPVPEFYLRDAVDVNDESRDSRSVSFRCRTCARAKRSRAITACCSRCVVIGHNPLSRRIRSRSTRTRAAAPRPATSHRRHARASAPLPAVFALQDLASTSFRRALRARHDRARCPKAARAIRCELIFAQDDGSVAPGAPGSPVVLGGLPCSAALRRRARAYAARSRGHVNVRSRAARAAAARASASPAQRASHRSDPTRSVIDRHAPARSLPATSAARRGGDDRQARAQRLRQRVAEAFVARGATTATSRTARAARRRST